MAEAPPRAVVYDNYGKAVPPHPGQGWTRFVCISDTHSRCDFPIPPGDVLLHGGDLSSWGSLSQLQTTMRWLEELPHPSKIIIAGNHDLCLDRNWLEKSSAYSELGKEDIHKARAMMIGRGARDAGIHYLEHESTELVTATGKRWKVYGSPAAPRYAPGSFQYKRPEEAKGRRIHWQRIDSPVLTRASSAIYQRIPHDTDILLTHTPPHRILDLASKGVHAGCPYLSDALAGLPDCRLHVFGHIHEGHGALIDEGAPGGCRVHVNAALPWKGQAVIVDLRDFP
ncbi:Metallo-dependent phosphatase [Auriscalpium vulgare]|uniref:Metallo-dependent phosphatase n=1 Tax=Auriscalpium vulgare TaxID=40419 RepID=A0ACB8RWL1_9AGAM|nr:Metallo-dependent phosphatase [Auriscalpium vulgare]